MNIKEKEMDALIEAMIPFGIIIAILIIIGCCLWIYLKYLTMKELQAKYNAYTLIAQEEELLIKTKQEEEKRNKEYHNKQMELINIQIADAKRPKPITNDNTNKNVPLNPANTTRLTNNNYTKRFNGGSTK